MKTLAIIVASFWIVTAAMAEGRLRDPGDRQKPARRRLEQLRQEVLQRTRAAAQKLHGARRNQLHQEVRDGRQRVASA